MTLTYSAPPPIALLEDKVGIEEQPLKSKVV